ncbi:TetR/AcrR family transcriptional regulator [Flavobacterium aquicola]|uniref:TetR family transcriptional regulator n=1 Tax=Flavobacterium aquicola TaxID=1682742 RepID=A0A3E0ENF4_9FLAO|nr:TetR/AcrR family transcriptional regulator [Flavobacterium aquicola]REG98869.1 TetR family transcriptional regulator [Flavobacterium aquicola]
MKKEELIISTALKLFVENGFHGTATSRIASESGVANGTLFNYFATKEILIVSIYNSIMKKMDDFIIEGIASNSVSKNAFKSLFVASLRWNLENPAAFQYMQQFNNSPFAKSAISKTLKQEEHPLYVLIKNGIDLVVLKPMPAALVFSLFNAQINGLYYYLLNNTIESERTDELTEDTFEMLWKMIQD